ncbi:Rz1 family lipoprotein, partial [Salmonella enterica subsp. diarizonae]|nr:Rz1 family lipoprotein [Salmonella enterica subsp. diarizonae]
MRKLRMMLCSAALMLAAGCMSKVAVQCQPRTHPPSPAAWAMLPPSNSLLLLDETFSVSEPELS